MTSVEMLLSKLRHSDVHVWVEGDRLRYRAPKGGLTPETLEQLRAHKADILTYLLEISRPTQSPRSTIGHAPRGETLPLSPTQQRLWFIDQLEPGTTAYNMPAALRLKGELHIAVLFQSIEEIVRRHEILRTAFPTVEGVPKQVILPEQPLNIPVLDLSDHPIDQQEAELHREIEAIAQHRFKLAEGCLWRFKLVRLAETDYALLLNIHHIISDGWSFGVFFRELATLYTAFLQQQSSPLPALPIQYADYAYWQHEWLHTEDFQTQLNYWKHHLSGQLPVLDLPTDWPRGATQTYAADSEELTLSSSLSQALKTLSQREGVTLFVTLLTAFKVLLSRHSGQDDIIVGAPVAGRNHVETEGLIGFFINTLVLRSQWSDNPSFRDLLRRVQDITLEAQNYQAVPFEKLVEELHPDRDPGRTPIFQVWFNMLNLEESSFSLPGLNLESIKIPSSNSKFDLTLYIREQQDVLHFRFVYNKALFKPERMQDMSAQFELLLQQIVEQPDTAITTFSLVTPVAAAQLPNPTIPLNADHRGFIHDRFVQQAQQYPERVAVLDAQFSWTYGLLDSCSNQLANRLRSHTIQPNDVVAIYGHRSSALVWAILGVLKAGAAFVILDPAYPTARLIHYLNIVNPKGFIHLDAAGELPPDLQSALANRPIDRPVVCSLCLPSVPSNDVFQGQDTTAPVLPLDNYRAYIAFTSGSTGQPKAVVGTHYPVSHFLQWYRETFDFKPSDRVSLLSGLAHDPLLRDVFTPLSVGATLCIPRQSDFETVGQLVNWMQQQQISVAHVTPAMVQLLAGASSASETVRIQTLRYVGCGGDRLTEQAVATLQQIAPQAICINFYGATETPQVMGYHVIQDLDRAATPTWRVPVGRGIQDVQLLILNDRQQLAGVGEVGEIYIRTPYLSQGYLNDEALTRSRFLINPLTQQPSDTVYRTGDYGRYQPDGSVEFWGRRDDQINIRGFRVELGEIEATLMQQANVQQAVVLAQAETPENQRLIAYVVPVEGRSPTLDDLRQALHTQLPHYMLPSALVLLEAIPLTPNGKCDRRALLKQVPSQFVGQDTEQTTQDELEVQLQHIWQDVLGVKTVGVNDNFFELGGHSLLAVQLFTQIKNRLHHDLPLATLFQAPSIRQLAQILRQTGWKPSWSALVTIQSQGTKPPFFFHGGAADAVSWAHFARLLGTDQPFYALQRPDLDGSAVTQTTVEALAAHCIEEMRSVQPHGPYFIGGHCFGGIVAFAIAHQLKAAGEEVALLAIIDSYAPKPFPDASSFSYQQAWHRYLFWLQKNYYYHGNSKGVRQLLKRFNVSVHTKTAGITKKLQRFFIPLNKRSFRSTNHQQVQVSESTEAALIPSPNVSRTSSGLSHELRYRRAEQENWAAKQTYCPEPYPGRIVLLRAKKQTYAWHFGEQLGWHDLATEGVRCIYVKGFFGNLFNRDFAPLLAAELRACLENAQSNSQSNY
jgi:amino acid adenylation domain-containing protein